MPTCSVRACAGSAAESSATARARASAATRERVTASGQHAARPEVARRGERLPAASVQRADHQLRELARELVVREVVELLVGPEARDDEVLALAILLDSGASVPSPDAGLLHAADRDLHRELVHQRVA